MIGCRHTPLPYVPPNRTDGLPNYIPPQNYTLPPCRFALYERSLSAIIEWGMLLFLDIPTSVELVLVTLRIIFLSLINSNGSL